jgi:hypothetical protein
MDIFLAGALRFNDVLEVAARNEVVHRVELLCFEAPWLGLGE